MDPRSWSFLDNSKKEKPSANPIAPRRYIYLRLLVRDETHICRCRSSRSSSVSFAKKIDRGVGPRPFTLSLSSPFPCPGKVWFRNARYNEKHINIAWSRWKSLRVHRIQGLIHISWTARNKYSPRERKRIKWLYAVVALFTARETHDGPFRAKIGPSMRINKVQDEEHHGIAGGCFVKMDISFYTRDTLESVIFRVLKCMGEKFKICIVNYNRGSPEENAINGFSATYRRYANPTFSQTLPLFFFFFFCVYRSVVFKKLFLKMRYSCSFSF